MWGFPVGFAATGRARGGARGGEGHQNLEEGPNLAGPRFGSILDQNGGSKTALFFGPPFGPPFASAWLALATTWPQKGPKMAPKRVPKEGPAGHVKSFIFDERYFKIATTEGSRMGSF